MNCLEKISYPLSQPSDWYSYLKSIDLGQIKDTVFVFNQAISKGELRYMTFQEGLWIQQMNFTLNCPLHLTQTAGDSNDLFIINFYLTNAQIKQKTAQREYDFQYDNVSIMLSSASAMNKYDLPADETIKIIQIGFSRAWLLHNVYSENHCALQKKIEEDSPIYISENLGYKFKYLLHEMDLKTSSRLHLFSNTLQLLNSFFKTIENRNFNQQSSNYIHTVDFEKLMKTRNYMDANPLNEISLEELSQQTAMSLSKFKRLFKQLFGLSPYSYHLKNKLSIAMEMIQNKKYSVSEAGLLIGYSNLSQFAKAFKNQFGMLPSELKL